MLLPLVRATVDVASEALATVFADIRPETRVAKQVDLQASGVLAACAANFASKPSHIHVDVLVFVKVGTGLQLLAANVAFKSRLAMGLKVHLDRKCS